MSDDTLFHQPPFEAYTTALLISQSSQSTHLASCRDEPLRGGLILDPQYALYAHSRFASGQEVIFHRLNRRLSER
jgi:hypothetical protein